RLATRSAVALVLEQLRPDRLSFHARVRRETRSFEGVVSFGCSTSPARNSSGDNHAEELDYKDPHRMVVASGTLLAPRACRNFHSRRFRPSCIRQLPFSILLAELIKPRDFGQTRGHNVRR